MGRDRALLPHLRPALVNLPLEDRHYLCPLCPSVLAGVEAAAQHAGTTHPDATDLTYLDLDDPKHMPDDPGRGHAY